MTIQVNLLFPAPISPVVVTLLPLTFDHLNFLAATSNFTTVFCEGVHLLLQLGIDITSFLTTPELALSQLWGLR